jgi:hypothetical protein
MLLDLGVFVVRNCHIDFNKIEVYEAGALLVSELAYPDTKEIEQTKRISLCQSLAALALQARYECDETWSSAPQRVWPNLAFRPEKQIAQDLKTLKRRLRDRIVAGRMLMPFLREAQGIPGLSGGMKRLSINEAATMVLPDIEQADPENVETRVWRSSIPVVHLAAAIQYLSDQLGNMGEAQIHIGQLMMDRDTIEYVVRNAKEVEEIIAKSTRLSIDPERLIRFRLV